MPLFAAKYEFVERKIIPWICDLWVRFVFLRLHLWLCRFPLNRSTCYNPLNTDTCNDPLYIYDCDGVHYFLKYLSTYSSSSQHTCVLYTSLVFESLVLCRHSIGFEGDASVSRRPGKRAGGEVAQKVGWTVLTQVVPRFFNIRNAIFQRNFFDSEDALEHKRTSKHQNSQLTRKVRGCHAVATPKIVTHAP